MEKSFGPDHPKVARGLNNLAGLLSATNRLPEAEPLHRRELAIAEKSFALDHQFTWQGTLALISPGSAFFLPANRRRLYGLFR
jgi:hypothetical protein